MRMYSETIGGIEMVGEPDMLKLSEEHWPSIDYVTDEIEVHNEIKKSIDHNKKIPSNYTVKNETCMVVLEQERGWYMKRQSRYSKVVRTIAWILRFSTNCRSSRGTRLSGELTAKEFVAAELVILKLTQQESFKDMDEPRAY